jgi:hypothetical protein
MLKIDIAIVGISNTEHFYYSGDKDSLPRKELVSCLCLQRASILGPQIRSLPDVS